jgi:magnesium transporter
MTATDRSSTVSDPDVAPGHFRIRRFDADRTDEGLTFEEAVSSKPSGRQLLWIDIVGDLSSIEAETLAGRFRLDPRTRRALETAGDRPHLALSGGYFHLGVAAEPEHASPAETKWLDVIAGRNIVISQHRVPIGFLDDLDDRIEADTTLGVLDSATFVATMLDSAVTSCFNAADAIEDDQMGFGTFWGCSPAPSQPVFVKVGMKR